MNDQSEPGLDAEQEATVRRLLAEARHDQPIPTDVAHRLDRVLAGLPREEETPAAVDLAARRRRRNAGRLLVAAAAVIVAGVGVGQLIGTSTDDSSDSDSSAGGPASAPERNLDDQSGSGDDGGGALSATPTTPSLGSQGGLPLDLSSRSFERDVRRSVPDLSSAATSSVQDRDDQLAAFAGFACPPDAAYGDGVLLPAYYDGVPAVLALRPPVGTDRLAELLECGTATRLRSFNLRVR